MGRRRNLPLGDQLGHRPAGSNWDLLDAEGSLTVTATSANPFTIDLVSLNSMNEHGVVPDFDLDSDYVFIIATFDGELSGFESGAFVLDSSGFLNPTNGQWRIGAEISSVALISTAVPEPGTALLMLIAFCFAFALLGRRRIPNRSIPQGS